MANPDILFKGVPRGHTRGFTLNFIRQRQPATVVVPCAGAFSLITTAVNAGVRPAHLHACDISLYSTALASAVNGTPLDVEVKHPDWAFLNPYMTSPTSTAAAILLTIRMLQYKLTGKPNVYKDHRFQELYRRRDVYHAELVRQLDEMRTLLSGMHYQAEDMMALIARHADDPNTVILANPPRYTGGYGKQFVGLADVFNWLSEPSVPQFTEDDYQPFMRRMLDVPATVLVYYATPTASGDDPSNTFAGWTSAYASRPNGSHAAINWILSNRRLDGPPQLHRQDTRDPVSLRYALLPADYPLANARHIEARRIPKDVAQHYRGILGHRLAVGPLHTPGALFVDGYLMGVFGLHFVDLYNSRQERGEAGITFAFSTRTSHHRSHKFLLLALSARWLWDVFLDDVTERPRFVRTTMLTPHPEVKSARGVMKLDLREKSGDAYRLRYTAEVRDEATPADTLQRWKDRFNAD